MTDDKTMEHPDIVISKLEMLRDNFGPVSNDEEAKHIVSLAIAAIDDLQKEAFALSANQCLHGIHGDEGGNSYCPRIVELELQLQAAKELV